MSPPSLGRARLIAALIVIVAPGCDNIDWGGADVTVVPPPPAAVGETEVEAPEEERLPEGPVVYHVTAADGRATLVPIGEISGDSLLPVGARADWEGYGRAFIDARLRPGSEFVLYRNGARVGTFILDSAGLPPAGACPRVPIGTGSLELAPNAAALPEFLALAAPQAPPNAPVGLRVPLEPDRRMEVLGPILAERLLRARNAPLPGSWSRAMAQLAPFPFARSEDPAFASTLLVGDSLGIGGDDEGYSLFFIAEPVPQVGFDTAYASLTRYEQQGKAAPRVVDYLDWDGDDRVELLLEVYGTQDAWFEVMDRTDTGWRRVLATRCE